MISIIIYTMAAVNRILMIIGYISIPFDTFDSSFFCNLTFSFNTPYALTYMGHLDEYTRLIVTEKLSSNIHKDEILNSLMYALLYSLSAQIHSQNDERNSNKYFFQFNQLRMEILNAPHKKWNIDLLAASSSLSPTHFQRLYKSFFGTTCMQDIIQARIKNAQFYLRTTEMSIYSLSMFCGYNNELHFMRQFKKYTGLTPSEYRKITKKN